MSFKIKLADQIIQIDSMYNLVYSLCKDYIVDFGEPSIIVSISQEDIDYERSKADGEWYKDPYLETLAVYRKIATSMIPYNTFLMHGMVVSVNNMACMVTAPSTTGKTTFLKTFLTLIDNAVIVNGDKPLIKVEDSVVYSCGTPWSGKEHLDTNCMVPLKMICLLKRGESNSLSEISFSDALSTLLSQTYRPMDTKAYIDTISLLGKLKHTVKFYSLTMKMYPNKSDIKNTAAKLVLSELLREDSYAR